MPGQNCNGRPITDIGMLEHSMFGTFSSPCFKLKGAETNYFMEFLVGAMPRFREALKEEFDPMLQQSGRCLMDLLSSIRIKFDNFQ